MKFRQLFSTLLSFIDCFIYQSRNGGHMAKLVSYTTNINKCIAWKNLYKSTESIPFSMLDTINWDRITELHILGSVATEKTNDMISDSEIPVEQYGGYVSTDKTWLLVLGAPINIISSCLSRCSHVLKNLDIRFTTITHIDLSNVIGVKRLHLAKNSKLVSITGLEKLENLIVLDLSHAPINMDLNLSCFRTLNSLLIRSTQVSQIHIDTISSSIGYFDAANTRISDCDFILKMPALKVLNLSSTLVKKLPDVSHLTSLEILNISHTEVSEISYLNSLKKLRTLNIGYTRIDNINSIGLPKSLRSLFLCGTPIKQIPQNIKQLLNLRRLVLADLQLESLPPWLPDLKLEFVSDNRYGINLSNTTVQGVDMSIFSQSRAVIEAWFRSNGFSNISPSTLNESKIIFLGDGGAGKSLTVQRLLVDGEIPDTFDGSATPGISITSKEYIIDDRNILVHFWDFGGQEILHSMHRMFLTKRTLYVILVNARDNTQDERARYWLHNIKSFADGSPVLLALNQIDQNPGASVNETALRELYPQLKSIIRLSARDYSANQFKEQFQTALLSEISNLPTLNVPFLPSWNLLKAKLQHMSKQYIDATEYAVISNDCGVENSDEIRSDLLDWFSDLGISFCYRDNSVLSNYLVLRPDWITNAIYIILFNGSGNAKNGLIKHETIHQLLHPSSNTPLRPKSVLNNMVYSAPETEYVLGVIRKFRLSYRIDDETEFIPMLCERNEKAIVNQYTGNDQILEFHMHYTYLPNNVIHRLMVEMRSHLDIDNVWLTGARFAQHNIGLSALVKAEDNTLKIYVKSENPLHHANTYLNIIKNTIERINTALGLYTTTHIVYRADSKSESFDYEYLIDSYEHGNREVYSRTFKQNLKILDILSQTDRVVTEKQNKLFLDIINVCQVMQSNKIYWHASEDARNTYIRDLLRAKEYCIADQTLSGKSASGKQAGELDIDIRESPEKPWTIYEALNISSFSETNKKNWNDHLSKLLDNYNPIGCPFLFLASYLECSKDNFKEIWLKYLEHISTYSPNSYALQKTNTHNNDSFFIRSAESIYDRGGLPTTVYHICVRLGD